MRRLHFVSLIVACLVWSLWPQPAEAGIVVIVMRETNPHLQQQDPGKEEPETQDEEGWVEAHDEEGTPAEDSGSKATRRNVWSPTGLWSTPAEAEATASRPPLEPVEPGQGWVDVEEDPGLGPVGCGGAQAARGPTGILPLALAAAALFLARRRRHA